MRSTHPSQPQWEGVLDRMLGEAVKTGEWQNLRGKGQKLNLDSPAGTPADLVMAHKIMEDNHVLPTWLEERKRLLARIAAWRDKLAVWGQAAHGPGPETCPVPRHQMQQCRQELEALNQAIADVNMGIPVWRMEVIKLDFHRELERAGIRPVP